MPEGPEICLAANFINTVSKDRLYGGQVVKSEVSTKNPDVEWSAPKYRVQATSRGKELKIILLEGPEETKNQQILDIIVRFGMSGSFKFTPVSELPKHAHLRFYTVGEEPQMVLSFVDYRRFGRWEVNGTWGPDRGPDPMWEYPSFRENVLSNLKNPAFNRPICEAMLNQKFFNGIGNYLRAEILYRCGIRPFDEAREVLSEIKPISKWYEAALCPQMSTKASVDPDVLDLCHILPKEVINLEGKGKGYNVDLESDEDDYAAFKKWLQCYYQDGMNNIVDHNKRTMWFSGSPGKLVPKGEKSRGRKTQKKQQQKSEDMKEEVTVKSEEKLLKRNLKTDVQEEIKPEKITRRSSSSSKINHKEFKHSNAGRNRTPRKTSSAKPRQKTQAPTRRSKRLVSEDKA